MKKTEVDIDLDELTAYVIKNAKKDKVGVYTEDEIHFVVDAEIAYCSIPSASLNNFFFPVGTHYCVAACSRIPTYEKYVPVFLTSCALYCSPF